ncbi:hypothetical protein Amet_4390 [Alkaliphilus metalliredigens QYMF]|uniref:Uncharacterized protein n=1 Tax=Alkaliphilus metalliredigens (strain QYMF) TaxID=293826 RepID=A6TKA2_ALKMQ|nr:hypothetical protein Amet_0392 [Alkaliphilus metalliredigens QYMF]ABR48093.1 hypothetical protein Amet_1930 [Alkaliphilus metalliredigens QYMF]ABR50464.1 hypothetical protein Amet_4390 [Alkaliphilus metalliredigens QYMF]
MEFQKGDRIKVTCNSKKPKSSKSFEGIVVGEYDGFITIHQGSYIVTTSKLEVINGNTTIEVLEKGETETVPRKKSIDKETLLKECIAYGWNNTAIETISEKYGLSKLTIKTYYGKWGIADLIAEKRDKSEVDELFENIRKEEDEIDSKKETDLDWKANDRLTKVINEAGLSKVRTKAQEAIGEAPHSEKGTLRKVMTIYKGDIMEYEIDKATIKIRNEENYDNYIIVAKEEILKFVNELHELTKNIIEEAK